MPHEREMYSLSADRRSTEDQKHPMPWLWLLAVVNPRSESEENKMSTKRCIDCRRVKSLEDFYKLSSATDGLSPYCKSCQKARVYKCRERNGQAGLGRYISTKSLLAMSEGYLERHEARRQREVEATNCLEDNNGESCEVLDFIKQEGGWRDQVNYFLRQPTKSFQFQVR